MDMKRKFATLLKADHLTADKRDRIVQLRLSAIGLGKPCGRCGGSGHYSFNQISGTTCFGCAGSGYAPQRLTGELFAAAQAAVDAGKLDTYLEDARRRQAVMADARRAQKLVMNAWTCSGITKLYDWTKAARKVEPDATISKFNDRMCRAHDAVSKASSNMLDFEFRARRAKNPIDRANMIKATEEAARMLIDKRDAALAEISAAADEAAAFLASHEGAK